MQTEKKRGGVRTASIGKKIGRPTKEPTKTISFRVPISKYIEIFSLLKNTLSDYEKRKTKV